MVAHQCGFDGEITQSVRCNASQVWSKMASSCVWEWDPDRDDCNGSPQVPIPSEYNLVPCFSSSAASVQSGLSRLNLASLHPIASNPALSQCISPASSHLLSHHYTSPHSVSPETFPYRVTRLTVPHLTLPHLIVAICASHSISAHLAVDLTSLNLAVPRCVSSHPTVPHLIVSLLAVLRSVSNCTSQPTLSCCPSPHTLPYLTSSHFTSLFCASSDRISSFLTVLHLTSPYLNSSHNTSSRLTILRPISQYSPRLTIPHLVPPQSTSSHLTSSHSTSHLTIPHLTPFHSTSPHLI